MMIGIKQTLEPGVKSSAAQGIAREIIRKEISLAKSIKIHTDFSVTKAMKIFIVRASVG